MPLWKKTPYFRFSHFNLWRSKNNLWNSMIILWISAITNTPWPFYPKINRAHPWVMRRRKVWSFMIIDGKHRQNLIVWKPLPITSTLTFDRLTPKSIANILDSGECLWSFMIIGGLHSQLWSGIHFQSPIHYHLDRWLSLPKSIGLILDLREASVWSFMVTGKIQSVMVPKPF